MNDLNFTPQYGEDWGAMDSPVGLQIRGDGFKNISPSERNLNRICNCVNLFKYIPDDILKDLSAEWLRDLIITFRGIERDEFETILKSYVATMMGADDVECLPSPEAIKVSKCRYPELELLSNLETLRKAREQNHE